MSQASGVKLRSTQGRRRDDTTPVGLATPAGLGGSAGEWSVGGSHLTGTCEGCGGGGSAGSGSGAEKYSNCDPSANAARERRRHSSSAAPPPSTAASIKPDEHGRPPVRGRRCGGFSGRGESWLGQLGSRRRGRQSDRLRRGCRERGARLRGRSSRSTSRRRRRSRPRLRAADRAGLGWRGRRGAHRSRRGSARRWRRRRLLRRPGDRSRKAEILKLARPDRLGLGRVGRRRAIALRVRGRLAEGPVPPPILPTPGANPLSSPPTHAMKRAACARVGPPMAAAVAVFKHKLDEDELRTRA